MTINGHSNYMYLLMLICFAMIIDFLSGTISARVNKKIEFQSKVGINGILKKILAMILLLFFIPICMLIPNNVGTSLLYTLYLGYFLMELQSILENYKKLGINISIFEDIQNKMKTLFKNDKER